MTAATRGRSKAVNVNKQSVEQAGSYLQELPEKPKENLSLREAVGQLRDQIQAALAKGYSYDDLAKMLTEKGIEISATTLKSYVPAGKRQSNKEKATATKPARTRRSRKTEEAPEAAAPAPEPPAEAAPEQTEEATEAKPTRRRTRTAAASAKEGRSSRASESKPATRSTRGRQKRS